MDTKFEKDCVVIEIGLIEITQDRREFVLKSHFFQVFPNFLNRRGVIVQSQDLPG